MTEIYWFVDNPNHILLIYHRIKIRAKIVLWHIVLGIRILVFLYILNCFYNDLE